MTTSPESRAQRFCAYARAAELLRQRFGPEQLHRGDVVDRFDFTCAQPWDRLSLLLPELAEVLLPLHFRIVLEGRVYGTEMRLRLHRVGREARVETERWGRTAEPPDEHLTAEGSQRYRELVGELGEVGSMVPLRRVLDLLEGLGREGVGLDLRLTIALDDKAAVARHFSSRRDPDGAPKVVAFLFPEAMAEYLATHSLAELEAECFVAGRRTVFLVFGLEQGFGNDLLAVAGRSWIDRLDPLLTEKLTERTLAEGLETRRLHSAGGVWLERHPWLRPEMFDPDGLPPDASGAASEILDQLRLLRVLLAAIFLSDRTEAVAGTDGGENGTEQRVKFQGEVEVAFGISRTELAEIDRNESLWADRERTERIDDLYRLYRYAYEDFKVDKLEIAQQFVPVHARDLPGLCTRATEVEHATRQTYHRSLQKGVAEYFDALQQIQDRIKSAVDEMSNSVLGLTREASSDLYKVAGLSIGALVGAFLKPDLTLIALLTVAAGIALYATLVIALHLPTFDRTVEIRLKQHRSYIGSFDKVLPKPKIDAFLDDGLLRDAEELLRGKVESARWLYGIVVAIAWLVVFGAVTLLSWR